MAEDTPPAVHRHIGLDRQPDLERSRRRTGRGRRPDLPQRNRSDHGRAIRQSVDSAVSELRVTRQHFGITPNRLLVLQFDSLDPGCRDVLEDRFGAVVVDERLNKDEDRESTQLIVQFPSRQAIDRLRGEAEPYRQNVDERVVLPPVMRRTFFDGLNTIQHVSREERIGNRLRREGFPDAQPFQMDVDLWHPGTRPGALEVLQELRQACQTLRGSVVDDLRTSSLILARVVGDLRLGEALLNLDIVAQVNLPPELPAFYASLFEDHGGMRDPTQPTGEEPVVTVVDSGVLSGHPLLRDWIVDEMDFDSGEGTPVDQQGHGTRVAGLAMYGSISECIERGVWKPDVLIASGKVLRRHESDETRVVFPEDCRPEAVISRAIRHFYETRGCRVFNLSVGNPDDVYDGGRQFAWAEALDELARELDIVIVVAAGNDPDPAMPVSATTREEFREGVRDLRLSQRSTRVLNPATAALAVTVGAIARSASPRTLGSFAGAPPGAPAPFSRVGPGYEWKEGRHGVKPDFVTYGGNFGVQSLAGEGPRWVTNDLSLGEPTTRFTSDDDRLLTAVSATSYAAPQVSHAAACAFDAAARALGSASANTARAILGVSADVPACGRDWLCDPEGRETWEKLRLVGFGIVNSNRVRASLDNDVCLVAADSVAEDRWHIYRIPVPASFQLGAGRRGISVALAFDPPVRSSRKEYLSRTMWVEVMKGLTLEDIESYRSPYTGEGTAPTLPSSKLLEMRPTKTSLTWSTLQVRRKEWRQFRGLPVVEGEEDPVLHVVVGCQSRFPHGEDATQGYGLAVRLWHSGAHVNLYQELRANVRQRIFVQAES